MLIGIIGKYFIICLFVFLCSCFSTSEYHVFLSSPFDFSAMLIFTCHCTTKNEDSAVSSIDPYLRYVLVVMD